MATTGTPAAGSTAAATPEAFVQAILPHAERAARELGVPARVLVAQAALETGWGQHAIKGADGKPSFNFFGIKADARWTGDAKKLKLGLPSAPLIASQVSTSSASSPMHAGRVIRPRPRRLNSSTAT